MTPNPAIMTQPTVYAARLSDPGLGAPFLFVRHRSNHPPTISNPLFPTSTSTDIKLKNTIASELRDQVEVFQAGEYARFLSILMPVFMDLLKNGQPVFINNAPEQVRSPWTL